MDLRAFALVEKADMLRGGAGFPNSDHGSIAEAEFFMASMIVELFRKTPFEPMRHHMGAVMKCVELVRPIFESCRDGKYDRLQELADRVFKLEHEADLIKDEIRQVIPTRFVLPVFRGDLLGYLKLQDDMADAVEDVAALLTLKQITIPKDLVESMLALVDKVVEVCEKTQAVADYLPTLVEGEMVGPNAEHALQLVKDVSRAEWEADRVSYKLSQKLFSLEDEMKTSDLILLFRVFGELGRLADYAENCGDRLRRMLSNSVG